ETRARGHGRNDMKSVFHCHPDVLRVCGSMTENRNGIEIIALLQHVFHGVINVIAAICFPEFVSPHRVQVRDSRNHALWMLVPVERTSEAAADHGDADLLT